MRVIISMKSVHLSLLPSFAGCKTKPFDGVPQGVARLNASSCDCQCVTCSENEFQCGGGECLPADLRCNGVIDCLDDELNCSEYLHIIMVLHYEKGTVTSQRNTRREDFLEANEVTPSEYKIYYLYIKTFVLLQKSWKVMWMTAETSHLPYEDTFLSCLEISKSWNMLSVLFLNNLPLVANCYFLLFLE